MAKPKAETKKSTKATKPAPVEEFDELEDLEDTDLEETEDEDLEDDDEDTDEDSDLEELDGDEDEEPAKPAKKAKSAAKGEKKAAAPKREKIEFGSAWLAEYVSEQTGKKVDGRSVRMLLRKEAKGGKLDRNVGEDRARYEFSGPKDPVVVAIVKAVKGGALDAAKNDGLEKARAAKAAKKAAAEEPVEETKPAKKAAKADTKAPAKKAGSKKK